MGGSLRANCAIVGTAESDLGQVAPGMTPVDLTAQGIVRALEDCGLALADVDGVFTATSQSRMIAMAVSEYLGIHPRYFDSTQVGGSRRATDRLVWTDAAENETVSRPAADRGRACGGNRAPDPSARCSAD